MVGDPRLRERVAQVRDKAKEFRSEFKRHSKEPNWGLVRQLVADPLVELRRSINEELARRQSDDALVPIDRDPVPRKWADLVRRYYEQIGSGD